MNTIMVRLVRHEALHHIDAATIRFCLGTHDHLENFALNVSYMIYLFPYPSDQIHQVDCLAAESSRVAQPLRECW